MTHTLTITTTRAKELAHWCGANLEHSVCDLSFKREWAFTPTKAESIYQAADIDLIVITFAHDDDRALFLLRWQGEFEEVSATEWHDRAGAVVNLNVKVGNWTFNCPSAIVLKAK